MTVDISRKTFDPRRHTAWTTTMQGRVTSDAPDNENSALHDRRTRAQMVDLAGRCGYPEILPDSFKIGVAGGELTVAPGRYYVDGQLADNFGTGTAVFDPVLSEMRGPDPVLFSAQPYGPGSAGAPADGTHIAYLDVWQRDVTFLEDATILDPAIATDTFARRQTVWQLRTFGPVDSSTTCNTAPGSISGWEATISPSRARLSTRANPANALTDPCLLPPGALYRGIDNRTYLVAIHGFTASGTPLIKFSRTNGTVATAIWALPQSDVLEVAQVAKDDFLRFNPGDWVEVSDEARLLAGQAGTMVRILSVDDASGTITLENPLPVGALQLVGAGPAANQARRPVLRRWDQSGEIRDQAGTVLVDLDAPGAAGLIPVPVDGTYVSLEDGVEAALTLAPGSGGAHINDNWSFISRFADTSVEVLSAAPPQDYHHHYCRLAMVSAAGGDFTVVLEDCRDPLDGDCCCTVTVKPGQSIQAAIDSLPTEIGGCVCLVAGVHRIDQAVVLTTSNVHIVGESRGAIIERTSDGSILQIDNARNIDVESVTFRQLGSGAAAIVQISDCESVNISNCALIATTGKTSTGIAVHLSHDVAIRDCDFGAMAFGIMAIGENGTLAIADNFFDLDLIGLIAIGARNANGALRITGNAIHGVINGIVINDDPTFAIRFSRADGSLIANNTIHLMAFQHEGDDTVQRGIDTAADQCVVQGNQIHLAGDACIGIFASGADLTIAENQIESAHGNHSGTSIGIVIGALDGDSKQDSLTQAVNVAMNGIRGTTAGIVARDASDVLIADNHLHDADGRPMLLALLLIETQGVIVRSNSADRSAVAIFAISNRHLSLLENRLGASKFGIVLLGEFAATAAGNQIDQAASIGIALALARGRISISGNRLRNCGSTGAVAGGIFALLVLDELVIDDNEIVDCGIARDGKTNSAAVFGIAGVLIQEALISANLVKPTLFDARPAGLEDRALVMLGLWQVSQGRNELTLGFPCTITNNKFYGTGRSALVELLQVDLTTQFWLRFERVFFTNNYCFHAGLRQSGATVVLNGSAAVVMGNQVKGFDPQLPSINLNGMAGTVVGNITSQPIINEPDFPATTLDFNLQLA